MKHSTRITNYLFSVATVATLSGLISTAAADDGPIEVRRVPTLAEADALERSPRAKPVASKSSAVVKTKSSPSTERRPIVTVKKAEAVDGSPASPKETIEAPKQDDKAEILTLEKSRARTMQPKKASPAPRKKSSGRVSWTERYELGPGDQLNFGLHGQPKLARVKVPVAPDWTISFLQAKQVSVRGRTIEELRVEMERVLSDFHRKPKIIITPAVLGSKTYTVLGKVRDNNTYKLDRPTTLLEAIAKTGGIKVGVRNANATELADLKRSFVVRDNKKLPVDIEKLYRTGDMEQNVQIEPGDYIYIASNVHNESYVFGSVLRPGTVPLVGNLTVMGAIAESGSYAKYAWKGRVLLIRGSVGNPEAHVINTREVLRGKEKDVLLQPGDIVYVHKRPWSYAEEIVDVAIKAYIQAAVAVKVQGENSVSIGL